MGFFSGLFGDGGKAQLEQGYNAYRGELETGYNQARPVLEQGFDDAQEYLDPFLQQGQQANQLYSDAIGVNGQPAQQGFYDNYQADPGFQDSLDFGLKAADRQANAGGRRYSGAAIDAAAGVGQRTRYGAVQNRLTRLSQLGSQGGQFAQASASNSANRGNALSNFDYGYHQQRGNAAQSFRNSRAQIDSDRKTNGINALSSLAGNVFKVAGGFS